MNISVSEVVADALSDGRPVVALETAVLTHGLPPVPHPEVSGQTIAECGDAWQASLPLNLATVEAMASTVESAGAVPAVVAILDGTITVGLDRDQRHRLAVDRGAAKASIGNLAAVMSTGRSAGTTVSATLAAAVRATPNPIRVFATGGIGGVHRGWQNRPDVSADLGALARHPVATICSGAKSILDLPATIEVIESLGIPLAGLGTDCFPRFHARGSADLPVPHACDTGAQAAALCRMHWNELGESSGVLLVHPPPAADAMDAAELESAVAAAESAADIAMISGPERTPWLLADIAARTQGKTLRANIALLISNARAAAAVAVALSTG